MSSNALPPDVGLNDVDGRGVPVRCTDDVGWAEIEDAKLTLGSSEGFNDEVGPLEIKGRNEADGAGAVVGREYISDVTVGLLVATEGALVGDLESDWLGDDDGLLVTIDWLGDDVGLATGEFVGDVDGDFVGNDDVGANVFWGPITMQTPSSQLQSVKSGGVPCKWRLVS